MSFHMISWLQELIASELAVEQAIEGDWRG